MWGAKAAGSGDMETFLSSEARWDAAFRKRNGVGGMSAADRTWRSASGACSTGHMSEYQIPHGCLLSRWKDAVRQLHGMRKAGSASIADALRDPEAAAGKLEDIVDPRPTVRQLSRWLHLVDTRQPPKPASITPNHRRLDFRPSLAPPPHRRPRREDPAMWRLSRQERRNHRLPQPPPPGLRVARRPPTQTALPVSLQPQPQRRGQMRLPRCILQVWMQQQRRSSSRTTSSSRSSSSRRTSSSSSGGFRRWCRSSSMTSGGTTSSGLISSGMTSSSSRNFRRRCGWHDPLRPAHGITRCASGPHGR